MMLHKLDENTNKIKTSTSYFGIGESLESPIYLACLMTSQEAFLRSMFVTEHSAWFTLVQTCGRGMYDVTFRVGLTMGSTRLETKQNIQRSD